MDIQNEIQELRKKISDIFFLVARYGVYTLFKGEAPTNDFDTTELNRLCFDGFKKGQEHILKELISLQIRTKELNIKLKEARKASDKELATDISKEIAFVDYQTDIFRNLADTITWQLVGGQHYILRRLYTHESGEKDLTATSFNEVISYSDAINIDRDSFCLICDITNNVQLGDCLVFSTNGMEIIEIKSGEVNKKALALIEANTLQRETFDEEQYKELYDKKYIEQIKRILEQKSKNKKAETILEKGTGIDPKYPDVKVTIPEETIKIQTYHETILELLSHLKTKEWAYECVEAVIHIGIYRDNWLSIGKEVLESTCKPFPVHDILEGRGIMICEPLFIKPFSDDVILDIVLGKIKIYIGVDFEKFIEFANYLGVPARWSTKKELAKILDTRKYNSKEIFALENKGIILTINDQEHFLGQGYFVKMIFDHFLPSSSLLMEKEG